MSERYVIATTRGDRIVHGHLLHPGLAMTPWSDDNRPGPGWSLTHVPSGRRLSSYGPMCWLCAEAMKSAASGIDWLLPLDELRSQLVVVDFVARIDRQVEHCTGRCG